MSIDDSTPTIETSEPVVAVRRLGAIMIYVSDLDRSIDFYKRVLGFTEGEQVLEPGVMLVAGDCSIYLTNGRTPAADRPSLTHPEIALALVVSSAKESWEKLRAADVRIVSEYEEANPYFASFRIADPDGNPLEIFGRP